MKIEKTQVFGFEAAIRGARNAMESWDRSDSCGIDPEYPKYPIECTQEDILVGPADLKLLSKLVKAGNEHAKCMRMVQVWTDMTLPLYIWHEWDTYKVGTIRCSCSTMHKLGKRDLTNNDFEDEIIPDNFLEEFNRKRIKREMNSLYREGADDTTILYYLKSILPCSYLMKSTINTNYQTLRNMYPQRKNHRLKQWHTICDWITALPYAKELIIVEK